MVPVSAPGTLVPSESAYFNRSSSNLHRIRNIHNKFQLKSRVGCALERKNVEGFEFPSFLSSYLSRQVMPTEDSAALKMATRIQRLPVETDLSDHPIMSSCVMPLIQNMEATPVVLLHGFDSSCLEWRYTYPLLEAGGMEPWAVDLLGWGFNNGEGVKSYNVAAKREHLYNFWRKYIKRPMALVGPSLGAAAAVDFAVCYPEADIKAASRSNNVQYQAFCYLCSQPNLNVTETIRDEVVAMNKQKLILQITHKTSSDSLCSYPMIAWVLT